MQVAELSGLSHPFLSQVENGRARPSFASLDRIARALGTTQVELFAALAQSAPAATPASGAVVIDEGIGMSGPFAEGSARVLVAGATAFTPMEFVSGNRDFGEYFVHDEEEFCYVVDGMIEADFGGAETLMLHAGQAFYYRGGTPHRWRSPDGAVYRVLVVKQRIATAADADATGGGCGGRRSGRRGGHTRMTAIAPEFDVVVRAIATVADDVVRVDLVRADGAPFPEWRPGAHVDLLLPIGVERQYSLCGDPADRATWTIGVLREPHGRGGSDWVHDDLEAGATLRVRGPWNHFAMADAARYRFVAGGIGITPLLPMIRAAAASGADWTLDYAGRSASRMAFVPEVAGLGGDRVRLHVADEGRRLDLGSLAPQPGELVYACGPARLLDDLAERAQAWPPSTAARRALRGEAPGGARAARVVRGRPAALGRDGHGAARPHGARGRRGGGVVRAVVVPRGHVRHLRDRRDRGGGRPPRLDPRVPRSSRRTIA